MTVSKIEVGERRCDPSSARKLAEALGVDLEELQAAPEAGVPSPMVTNLTLHRAYLKRLLAKEAGSAYSALDEEEVREALQEVLLRRSAGDHLLEASRA